ncbi:helix-turn-helix domain-containing protein [Aromatoleum toluolicum]|uniref:Helix-turn-helix domain-containing protein n=1 Tax=Aromatoleum toluolicum TaxID=90060 RepID=A0ABX1NGI0_9RHOO|nr:helix-turn-helix domain-containing protein [Aromatoleum toluolicum]
MPTVQEIILRLRAAGYSQTRIANEIGAPQPRISRWERGEAPDSADDALKLANLLAQVDAAPVTSEGVGADITSPSGAA